MIEFHSVFIDTAPFIYLLDKDPNYGSRTVQIFQELLNSDADLFSSVITCEEYLIAPYRVGNLEKEQAFFALIADCGINIRIIDKETALKAAEIRAKYSSFKSMDALQLASAYLAGCDLFLTNDKQLLQFREIRCVTLDKCPL